MKKLLLPLVAVSMLCSCQSADNEFADKKQDKKENAASSEAPEEGFKYVTEQFADLRVQRYQVTGFDSLDLKKKTLLYYLYEAALSGRDIIYDQNYKYNLAIRRTLDAIVEKYKGDAQNEDYGKLLEYAKRVWFSNGIHHHYSHDKFVPGFSKDFLRRQIEQLPDADLPLNSGQSKADFATFIVEQLFNNDVAPKKVNQDTLYDLVQSSAVNFYEGVTEEEATAFYDAKAAKDKSSRQPMYGLNSKLVKENGKLVERTWKVGGMYSAAITKIVGWLEKAATVAENEAQKKALLSLIKYYQTGDLADFDKYSVAWVQDTASTIDVVNGFIEVYSDPLGKKGSFESVVSVKDFEASKRITAIGAQAQWFEDNSPILPEHKKKKVKGISAKVINAVIESGDAAPTTPIGINLPNSRWIREEVGSKSVNLGNIVEAYENASGGSVVDEFYYNQEIRDRVKKYAGHADKLHTDMHEVIGHASGRIEAGVGQPHETLKQYASALEEGRADLVALYYLMDPKLVELGVMPSLEYGKASYDDYITSGLIIQLARIKKGQDIEEAHMRNRKFISAWCLEKGQAEKVIEQKIENGHTYYVINDYKKLRKLFGDLLREVQRIISQGDYKAGSQLVEGYGVKIDQELHEQVLERYARLKIAPYAGFIQPRLIPVFNNDSITDVRIEYPSDFTKQMLEYGRSYSFLPVYN